MEERIVSATKEKKLLESRRLFVEAGITSRLLISVRAFSISVRMSVIALLDGVPSPSNFSKGLSAKPNEFMELGFGPAFTDT